MYVYMFIATTPLKKGYHFFRGVVAINTYYIGCPVKRKVYAQVI